MQQHAFGDQRGDDVGAEADQQRPPGAERRSSPPSRISVSGTQSQTLPEVDERARRKHEERVDRQVSDVGAGRACDRQLVSRRAARP